MPLPQALPQWRDLKAAYRCFDNAKAVPEHILASHIDATWSRTRSVPLVLAVQDTTYLNWEHHPTTQGLGGLSDAGRRILCHSTLAVTPERLPLGLLAQRNWVRDDDTFGALPSHKKRAIDDKESIKWLESAEALAAARGCAANNLCQCRRPGSGRVRIVCHGTGCRRRIAGACVLEPRGRQ